LAIKILSDSSVLKFVSYGPWVDVDVVGMSLNDEVVSGQHTRLDGGHEPAITKTRNRMRIDEAIQGASSAAY
jgi:hypothetical protein